MAAMKRGLGRGLDALLSTVEQVHEPVTRESVAPLDGYRLLSVDAIQRGRYQPRRDLEPGALEELADSIRAQGIMQPIVVRSVDGNDRFEIIAGERRWRAGQMAGLTEIPVLVREVSDESAIAMALIENIQRENLNPIEEAVALQRLQQEFELTQQQVAKAVGKSRSTIANLLRLMKLEEEVKKMLDYGDLEMGHARALLALESEAQLEAARDVVARGLTVRQTEALVRKLQTPQPQTAEPARQDPALEQLAGELSARFSALVSISRNTRGKGKISIAYNSEAELNAILENLK
ncbi:ParB/RepB/Spo0J family partition protein [Marinobacterium sedimentorum]|uniref:ParB/RepB/Spo0J family partition protein n=1 Tax=Marinobacterium sedimentorum TaxID=2927804 RepID=UPI0020C683D7|nr:ParB/RepB/Spo0J family partition protein [Marinobacterium sedimentorum]MCP8688322.1 ParB/RepB/Spo0J family partition protein [Marinobacterium sedimentorum]